MRVQIISAALSVVLASGLNLMMAPSLELDVAGMQARDVTGLLELKRGTRRNELALVDLQVVAQDLAMMFGRKERVRYLLVSARSADDGGEMLLWVGFGSDETQIDANARDASALSHRTLPIVVAPSVLPVPSSVTLPRKGPMVLKGGTLRITSALPLPAKRGAAVWHVRGEVDLDLAGEQSDATEAWGGHFKGRLVWP